MMNCATKLSKNIKIQVLYWLYKLASLLFYFILLQNKAKQNKAKQNKTYKTKLNKQIKTKQNKTKQYKTKQTN